MPAPLKHGPWKLTDLADVPKNGLKVFSCFHCGGGSTMGYKLAGYEVLGGVEIDPQMMAIYRANHQPKHSYLMGVAEFNKIPDADLPPELFALDVLDGSPPCSSFSMAGSREKAWGDKKKFREGQAEQVLDDLFFHFIETARKLQPKVVVAENVKGLVAGNARGYVKEIFQAFRNAGYEVQLFLLNAASMGVPQRRERTFFVASRIGRKISFDFREQEIAAKDLAVTGHTVSCNVPPKALALWEKCKEGANFSTVHPKGHSFNSIKVSRYKALPTIAASYGQGSWAGLFHWSEPRQLTIEEYIQGQTFPLDFNFKGNRPIYICGMSVPPFMMQRVADQIERQLLSEPANG